ncbi:MAG: DUF3488 and transglutaminase-like domain-containing protein [Aeromicrobium sp.]
MWSDHALLAIALAVLLWGFTTVIDGRAWFVSAALVTTLAVATCAVLRAVGVRRVAPFAVLVELFALAWIFVPSTMVSIIPTPDTLVELGRMLGRAQDIIVEERAPIVAADPVILVIAAAFGLLAILGDWLLERPLAAQYIGLMLVAVFVAPSLTSGDSPAVWIFLVVAVVWLFLLRARTRERMDRGWRGRSPALIVAALALALSVAVPPVLPDIRAVAAAWGEAPTPVFGRGINPMLELGQNLRRNSTSQALTYTTNAKSASYLKVSTLRDFTGKTWKPGKAVVTDTIEGQIGLDPDIVTTNIRTTVTIKNLRSSLVPSPYPALSVSGLQGGWQFERVGLTIRSARGDTRGQTYTVNSLKIAPTADQMREFATRSRPSLVPYLVLPKDMPSVIEETARAITENDSTDYDKALSLQSFLRNGSFRYSETAPVADGFDGNGVDVIAKFLEAKQGYCVHFSSTMAVMARTLDIPSRIAVGYAPGDVVDTRGGKNVYANTSDDLHAWTELYFQGAGWVGFEPTPGVGSATAFAEKDGATPEPTGSESDSSQLQDGLGGSQFGTAAPKPNAVADTTTTRTLITTGAGLLLLGITPLLLRRARRLWRRRRATPDPLWRELEDTAQDYGIVTSRADTPRGFAARLRTRKGVDIEALDKLLRAVEKARFSRDGGADDSRAELRAVIRSLGAGASRGERLRAAALPRSLAGRGTYAVLRPQMSGSEGVA